MRRNLFFLLPIASLEYPIQPTRPSQDSAFKPLKGMTESDQRKIGLACIVRVASSFCILGLLLCLIPIVASMAPTEQESLAAVAKSVNDFSLDLYLATAENAGSGKNILVSPLSAALVTAMVHAGAKGKTADEIASRLYLPTEKQTLESGFKALHNLLSNTSGVTLEVANKLFLEATKDLNANFKDTVKSVHNSDVEKADFINNAEKARVNINDWVADKTHQKIKDLLQTGVLTSDTRLVLVNALYFFGKWKNQFESSQTYDEDFHVSKSKIVKVPMMHQTKTMRYADIPQLDAKAVELCYTNENVCLQIILPNAKDGLENLQKKLREKVFDLSKIEFHPTKVQLSLPKFKIEETINLKSVYQKMGISSMFNEQTADLSGMINGDEKLVVSEAVQKTFMEVNEEGTEAAAATALVLRRKRCLDEMPLALYVNHPFLFRLMNPSTVIFVGSLYEPTLLSSEDEIAKETEEACFNDNPHPSDDARPHKPSHCEL